MSNKIHYISYPLIERKLSTNRRRVKVILCVLLFTLLYSSIRLIVDGSIKSFKPVYNVLFVKASAQSFLTQSSSYKLRQANNPYFNKHLSDHQPYLPHPVYFRTDIPSDHRVRLILLANGFFGERNWFYKPHDNKTNTIMESVYCPLLQNYCNITTDMSKVSQADAFVFHGRDFLNRTYFDQIRRPDQRTVFALWESPINSCSLRSYSGFFNWTMTYRLDSDIVTTYASNNPYIHTSNPYFQMIKKDFESRGSPVQSKSSEHNISKDMLTKKIGTVATLMSNCGQASGRLEFIERLRDHTDVEIFGACGKPCPNDVDCRQYIAEKYYFYLSFENSLCTDYVSEKFFFTIKHPIVPVVLGRVNYSVFIPPSGYINVVDFDDEAALAQHLNGIRKDEDKYRSYFKWKEAYAWLNTPYYFYFCDLCVRLHLDKTTSIYEDIHSWWSHNVCLTRKSASIDGRIRNPSKIIDRYEETSDVLSGFSCG